MVSVCNFGENKFMGCPPEGIGRHLTEHICLVNKVRFGVGKVVQASNKLVFDSEGSCSEDRITGREDVNEGRDWQLHILLARPE